MKTENELNSEILKNTNFIQENFSELLKHIGKTPIHNAELPFTEINQTSLKAHNNLLDTFWKCYTMNHDAPHFNKKIKTT